MSAEPFSVELQNPAHERAPPARRFVQWVRAALGPERGGEVTIRIVDEAESAALNTRYRGGRAATNVLSFACEENLPVGEGEPVPIGDLVICAPVVEREAAEQGKAVEAHWAHMTVHGVLHLLGHDHELDAEAAAMENREREILATLGIADPYD